MPDIRSLPIADIRMDGNTQPRDAIDMATVHSIAEAIGHDPRTFYITVQ